MQRGSEPAVSNQVPPQSLLELVKSLSAKVSTENETVTVRRGHVLEDALRTIRRKSFSVTKTIVVSVYFYMYNMVDAPVL